MDLWRAFVKSGLSHLIYSCIAVYLASLTLSVAFAVESHPGMDLESLYSEAVLAYNKNLMNEALQRLDEVLRASPGNTEALELQALTYKAKGDEEKSLKTYEALLKLKPAQEVGAYHFEIGVILNHQKKYEQAKSHLEKAIQLKVNVNPSHLFLGMIAFNTENLKGAAVHFKEVKRGGNQEFTMIASYYIGLIYFKSNDSVLGVEEFNRVRTLAESMPDSETVRNIKAGVDRVLSPFDQGRFFASVSTVSQYDSNISQLSVSAGAASNKATPKIMLSGVGGWMGATSSAIQTVWTYRGSYNKNLNAETKSYEFVTNVPSLYINLWPLEATNGGLKIEGSYMFQNQIDNGVFAPYSLAGDIGPFVKMQLDPKTQVSMDWSLRPAVYYKDTGLNVTAMGMHMSYKRRTNSKYFNPSLNLSYDSSPAQSREAAYKAMGFGGYNAAQLSPNDQLITSLDFVSSKYAEAAVPRDDKNMSVRFNWTHSISSKLSVLTDFTYIKNTSNIEEGYTYNRMMMGVGASWNM